MRVLKFSMAVTCLTASLAAVADAPYSGRYLGTGRACYGVLTITDKHVEWQTPSSKCPPTAYKIVEQGGGRVTFRLVRSAAPCSYGVVSLVHHAGKSTDDGWEVMGYRDERTFREHKAGNF